MPRASRRLAAAALVCAARAFAAEPCALVHEGREPDDAWSQALDEARRRLSSPAGAGDCREVRVTLDAAAQGARVRFRTRDGREAVRPLGAAAELMPTLEALLVTFGPASGSSDVTAASSDRETASRGRGRPAREPEEQTNAPGASLVFGVGGRLAAVPGAYFGPHLDVQGQAHAGPWVAGILLESAPSHVALAAAPDGFTLMTYGVSLSFGRRHSMGTVSLGYAARAGVQVLAEEAPPQPGVPLARALEVWQPRVGVEGYGLVPLADPFALRFGASVDTPVARFANPAAESRALPSFPRLGATASIGIEARLL